MSPSNSSVVVQILTHFPKYNIIETQQKEKEETEKAVYILNYILDSINDRQTSFQSNLALEM